jgi:hypothetical protein
MLPQWEQIKYPKLGAIQAIPGRVESRMNSGDTIPDKNSDKFLSRGNRG